MDLQKNSLAISRSNSGGIVVPPVLLVGIGVVAYALARPGKESRLRCQQLPFRIYIYIYKQIASVWPQRK
jgi:hypothetical protein